MITPRLASVLFILALARSLAAAPAVIFSTGFDTPADFEANFVALKPSGEALLIQDAHVGGLGLRKTGPGTLSVIFDSSAQGGKNGQAGTAGSATNANFKDIEVATSVRFVDFNDASLGFWSRVPADYGAGLLGLINVIAAEQVRLRIFGAGSQPLSATPGKLLKDVILKPTMPLDNNTVYRAVFRTSTTAEGIKLQLMLRDSQGTLAAIDTVAAANSGHAQGQVGLRTSSKTLIIDELTLISL